MKWKAIDIPATSKRLKEMSKAKGYKETDIAKAMGNISERAVYKWFSVRSDNLPTLEHLVQLSSLLDCGIDDLLVLKEIDY